MDDLAFLVAALLFITVAVSAAVLMYFMVAAVWDSISRRSEGAAKKKLHPTPTDNGTDKLFKDVMAIDQQDGAV